MRLKKQSSFLFIILWCFHSLALADESSFAKDNEMQRAIEKMNPQIVLRQLRFGDQEEVEESRRLLESALAFDSGNADYHFELSRVYGALYDMSPNERYSPDSHLLDMSQEKLNQVLMIRPDDIPAHYNLGVIHKRRGRMELARDAFRKAIYLNKKKGGVDSVTGSAWLQIGSVYEEQGFYEEAQEAYMEAREIGGPRPEIQDALNELKIKRKYEITTRPERADGWNREFVSGSDYVTFGRDAIKGQTRRAGTGALIPLAAQMLFHQFTNRRNATQGEG